MSGPLFDCYVLAPTRTAATAMAFLDRFLPEREAAFESWDPADVLGVPTGASTGEIADFLEANSDVRYTMYWRHSEGRPPYFAMVSFTADGQLILGLSPCHDDDPDRARRAIREMMAAVSAEHGYVALEEAPASSREGS